MLEEHGSSGFQLPTVPASIEASNPPKLSTSLTLNSKLEVLWALEDFWLSGFGFVNCLAFHRNPGFTPCGV